MALSPLMLKMRLSTQHRDKWMLFVKAARILCKPALTTSEARKAHLLLMEFCRGCVSLYGKNAITPNIAPPRTLVWDRLGLWPLLWILAF